MKTIEITLKGTAPLLINRFKENDEQPKKLQKSGKRDFGSPREQAEQTTYVDERTKLLWIPSSWITGAINSIASDYKLVGSRKSLKSVSGGAIIPTTEKIYFTEKYKLKDIEIDSRPVVIQRSRIMRHRARLEEWNIKFSIEVDESIIPVDQIHEVMNDAGRRAGLGDFRPSKSGPFGRYHISSWKIQGEKNKRKKVARKKISKK